MTGGSGLMDFVIAVVGLCVIVALIFLGLDKISQDEQFKKIARYAVGGVALILFLYAVKAVLFGGGGFVISPPLLIQFAIGLIILIVVIVFCTMAVNYFAPDPLKAPITLVISALAVIVVLLLAAQALSGPGSGMRPLFGPSIFAPEHR